MPKHDDIFIPREEHVRINSGILARESGVSVSSKHVAAICRIGRAVDIEVRKAEYFVKQMRDLKEF